MPIDFADPRPAYQQIADDLRERIKTGRLKPGDRMPSRKTIAEEYAVAPETVKKAQDELAREGLITARSTRGTFILRTPQEAEPSAEFLAVMDQLKHLAERVDAMEAQLRDLNARDGVPGGGHDPTAG